MQKTLLTTTALVALVSVTAMAEEFDVSGETSLGVSKGEASVEYDFSLGKSFTTDNSHVLGGRLDVSDDGLNPNVYWEGGAGKLTIGNHDGPARTMSLGSDLRGTIPAAGEANTNVFQDASTPRVSFQTPSVAGFMFGASASSESERQYGVNYTLPIGEATIKLGHSRSTVGNSGSFLGGSTEETGVEFKMGKFTASFVNFAKSETKVSTVISGPYFTSPGTVQRQSQIMGTFTAEEITSYDGPCEAFRQLHNGQVVLAALHNCQTGHPDMTFVPGDVIYNEADGTYRYADPTQPYVLDGAYNVQHPGALQSLTAPQYVPGKTSHTYGQETTTGQELEIAYQFTDKVIGNAVKYRTDQGYDRLSVGVGYQINDDMSASISQSRINDNGVKDTAYLARLTYSF